MDGITYTWDNNGNLLNDGVNTYTYDSANELLTAQVDNSPAVHYTYDANGNLLNDGVKTYAYDSANRLVSVSSSSGTATMAYNGLGQRLSMSAAGVTTQYVLDNNQVLTATSGSKTTFYLYGLGAVGELTDSWSYDLSDGTNTPRQLVNASGEVTFAARYTPWGDTLESNGTGNITFGYMGGLMDTATGLLYMGNGNYYDPTAGRFLNRNANPNGTNLYVPWGGEPSAALMAPLSLLSLFYSRKRKRGTLDTIIILLVLGVSLSLGLTACGTNPAPTTPTPYVFTVKSTGGTEAIYEYANGTLVAVTPSPLSTPLAPIIATACATPSLTVTATGTPTPTPAPDLLDRSKLDNRSNKFYDLYLAMYNEPSEWWWKDYGGTDGFKIWDFMAIMWSYDVQLNIELVKEAMHNRAALFCPGGCNPATAEGSLTYLAGYAQSARDRVDGWKPGTDPATVMDNNVPNKQIGVDIVEQIRTSTGQDLTAMSPFDYGNISLNPVYAKMVSNGWVLKSLRATSGDTFFVLSHCQYYFAQEAIYKGLPLTQTNYNSYCY